MRLKATPVFLAILISFSACTPLNTPVPASTSVPPSATSIRPTETSTPRPGLTLQQDTSLFSGPGNADFDILAPLKAGDTVNPIAMFGDFIKVEAAIDGETRTGYVWKEAAETPATNIPILDLDQVPLKPLYAAGCSPGIYDQTRDTVVFTNPTDDYYDTESSAIRLDASLLINMSSIDVQGGASAAIKLLGIPEPVGDNWWKGITRLDLGYDNGSYFIGIRDGSSEVANVFINLPLKTTQGIRLVFDRPSGSSLRILDDDGNTIDEIDVASHSELNLHNGLFPDGVVYIGTTVSPHTSFTVTGLNIGVQPSGTWTTAANGYYTYPGLAELAAKHSITIGTEFGIDYASDPRYCRTMKRDFNVAVLSEFSSPNLWLGPGQYDFSAADRAVDYAIQHGWRVRASHLLWGAPETLPNWLTSSHYSRDEYIQLMQQYILDVASRYRGRVSEWSVANEASNRSFAESGADFWNDTIGPDYIALALRAAREADPDGILIFNDDNNHAQQDEGTTRVIDKMYATVQQLKADGVPVDVVGMQMHIFLPWSSRVQPQKEPVIATMRKFAALGVRIYITELDIDTEQLTGTSTEKSEMAAQIYEDMVKACIESGVCHSFATWGISDATSWITCDDIYCIDDKNAEPLMFDINYNPKPTYFSVRDALLNDFSVAP
jgi:endo-1,4-beta-xylanase